jgi:hypothetical protein
MPAGEATRDWMGAFNGVAIVEAIDALYRDVCEQYRPKLDRVVLEEAGHNWWAAFAPYIPADPNPYVPIRGEILVVDAFAHRWGLRSKALCVAAAPLISALQDGHLLADGVAGADADYAAMSVPAGFWRGAAWIIYRKPARLVALASDRNEIDPVFWDVRLRMPSAGILEERPVVSSPRRARGRPSRREEIIRVFEDLDAAGKIDYAEPATAAYHLIREHLRDAGPKGLDDDTMRKAIGNRFSASKFPSKL